MKWGCTLCGRDGIPNAEIENHVDLCGGRNTRAPIYIRTEFTTTYFVPREIFMPDHPFKFTFGSRVVVNKPGDFLNKLTGSVRDYAFAKSVVRYEVSCEDPFWRGNTRSDYFLESERELAPSGTPGLAKDVL